MAFPEPERFTIQDVATRWGKSWAYVAELVRTFQFESIVCIDHAKGRLPIERHYYFTRACWPYGKGDRYGLRAGAVARFMNSSDCPEGFQWSGDWSTGAYIPRKAVEAFEGKHNVVQDKARSSHTGKIMDKPTYTVQEAARRAGVHVSTIRRWIADGNLKATRTAGHHRRISHDDLSSSLKK